MNIFVGTIDEEKWGLSLIDKILELDTKAETALRRMKLNVVLVATTERKPGL